MNEVSGKIVAIKTEVREQNWETMMFECRQSELPMKKWCKKTDSIKVHITQGFENCVKRYAEKSFRSKHQRVKK